MSEREPKPSGLKVITRRELLTFLWGVTEATIGYASYRTDILAPEHSKAVTMSGVSTSSWLIIGRVLGFRGSLFALIAGHTSGATTLLFEPPKKFKDR